MAPSGLQFRRWVTTSINEARKLSAHSCENSYSQVFVVTHPTASGSPSIEVRELDEAFQHEEYDWLVLRLQDGTLVLAEDIAQEGILRPDAMKRVFIAEGHKRSR